MKAKKPTPRSLFKRVNAARRIAPTANLKNSVQVDAAMLEFGKFLRSLPTQQQQLEARLQVILDHAERTEQSQRIENRARRGRDLRVRVERVRRLSKSGPPVTAVNEALALCEAWMELRMDAMFAIVIRDFEKQTKGIREKGKRPKDNAVIADAYTGTKTKKAAAKKLGVSDRTERRWRTGK